MDELGREIRRFFDAPWNAPTIDAWAKTFPKGVLDVRTPAGKAVVFQFIQAGRDPVSVARATNFDELYDGARGVVRASVLAAALPAFQAPEFTVLDRTDDALLNLELRNAAGFQDLFNEAEMAMLDAAEAAARDRQLGFVRRNVRRMIGAVDSWLDKGDADPAAASALGVAAVAPRLAPAALTAYGSARLAPSPKQASVGKLIGSPERVTIEVAGNRRSVKFVKPMYEASDSVRYALEIPITGPDDAWNVFGELAGAHGKARSGVVAPYTPQNLWTNTYMAGPIRGTVGRDSMHVEFDAYPSPARYAQDVEAKAAPGALFEGLVRHLGLAVDSSQSAPAPPPPAARLEPRRAHIPDGWPGTAQLLLPILDLVLNLAFFSAVVAAIVIPLRLAGR